MGRDVQTQAGCEEHYLSEIFLEQAAGPAERAAVDEIALRLHQKAGGQLMMSECGMRLEVRSFSPLLNDIVADQLTAQAFPSIKCIVQPPRTACA